MVNTFNKEHFTAVNINAGVGSYQLSVDIPCTDAEPILIGFSAWDIIKRTFIPSLFIAVFAHLFLSFIRGRQLRIKRDRMTGFYRRDFYEPKLNKVCDFSMLIIDIDFFKTINDTYGHKTGDDVITEVTHRIASQIRSSDVAVRWGGEEFVILFKDMTREMLREKAQLICKHVADTPISNFNVTISIGGVHLRDGSFSEAYKMADSALYDSKNSGRNRETIYNPKRNSSAS